MQKIKEFVSKVKNKYNLYTIEDKHDYFAYKLRCLEYETKHEGKIDKINKIIEMLNDVM
jgi:ferritin